MRFVTADPRTGGFADSLGAILGYITGGAITTLVKVGSGDTAWAAVNAVVVPAPFDPVKCPSTPTDPRSVGRAASLGDLVLYYTGGAGTYLIKHGSGDTDWVKLPEAGAGGSFVPTTRTLTTTAPLKIDGGASADLSADRTLSVDTFSSSVKGAVPAPGSTSGYFLRDDGTWQSLSFGAPSLILGVGYDGGLNFDGSSTVLGLVPSGSVYTLTRSINPTNMTVAVGVTVKAAGYSIIGTGTLTLNGTISNSGSAAPGVPDRAGGAGAPAGDLPGGTSGGNGGLALNAPNTGTNSSQAPVWASTTIATGGLAASGNGSNGASMVGGGGGGGGTAGGVAGADGGTCTRAPGSGGSALNPIYGLLTGMSVAAPPAKFTCGSGGGGGPANSAGSLEGGGGGGGGGWATVMFYQFAGSGSLKAVGGAGGAGAGISGGGQRAGGGGGGGGGGVITVGKFVGSFPTCDVSGGSGGAAGLGSTGAASGGAGGNGGGGIVNQLSLASGVGAGGGGGTGLPDGDYGDIVVSGSTTVLTIDAGVVDSTKLASSAVTTAKIATGAVDTTKLGGDITTAGKDLLDDASAAAQRTTLGLGTIATQSSVATTDIASVTTARIIGRTTAATGTAEQLTGTQATALLDVVTTSVKGLAPTLPNDATKFLDGTGAYSVPAGAGGGGGASYTYTTKTTDSFNRANSTTSLGTTDGASALDPLTWVQNRGTWGINTNTAYVSATGAGTQLNNATVSLAAGTRTHFVQATVTTLPTQNSTSVGIMLGLVDANNFYYLQCNRSSGGAFSYALARFLAGVGSTLLSISNVPSANDVIRLERVQYGIISVFINGTLVGAAFDGAIPTGVKVGLLDITTGGVVSGGRLDVFSAGTIA